MVAELPDGAALWWKLVSGSAIGDVCLDVGAYIGVLDIPDLDVCGVDVLILSDSLAVGGYVASLVGRSGAGHWREVVDEACLEIVEVLL